MIEGAAPAAGGLAATFKDIRRQAWWVNLVLGVLAADGVGAVLVKLAGAGRPGLAGMSAFETFLRAFVATLAWSVGVAIFAHLGASGQLQGSSYGLAWKALGCLAAGSFVATLVGRVGSSAALSMPKSASAPGLFARVLLIFGDYVRIFGPTAFLSGLVVGVAAGVWSHRLMRAA